MSTPAENIAVKALSLWESWATAMMLGLKKNETRGRRIGYRGPLVICAAKSELGLPSAKHPPLREYFSSVNHNVYGKWPLGCALGMVDLIDCVPSEIIRPKLSSPATLARGVTAEQYCAMTLNMRHDLFITYKGVRITGSTGADITNDDTVVLFDDNNGDYEVSPGEWLDVKTMELDFGDYTNGRWIWVTENLRVFKEPVPHKGNQGLSIYSGPLDFVETVKLPLESYRSVALGMGSREYRSLIYAMDTPDSDDYGAKIHQREEQLRYRRGGH